MTKKNIKFKINGQPVTCNRDEMLLEVARRYGFDIPAPCHHDALPDDYGACRLCLVEIQEERWTGIDTACTYPVREKCIEVRTDTDQVQRYRHLNLELLLSRCPQSETVRALAREMGVAESDLPPLNDSDSSCILCGMCVNVCEELIGAGAIGFVGRGAKRRVAPPFDEPSESCIGCTACAQVCPTGVIDVIENGNERTVAPFSPPLEMVSCPECGKGYATEKQIEFLKKQLESKSDVLNGCPACKVNKRVREFADTLWLK